MYLPCPSTYNMPEFYETCPILSSTALKIHMSFSIENITKLSIIMTLLAYSDTLSIPTGAKFYKNEICLSKIAGASHHYITALKSSINISLAARTSKLGRFYVCGCEHIM